MRFVRRACDALREYDMWGSGFSSWPDVPWRRSALQFVLDQPLGPDSGVCISVTDRLQRCVWNVCRGSLQGLGGGDALDVRDSVGCRAPILCNPRLAACRPSQILLHHISPPTSQPARPPPSPPREASSLDAAIRGLKGEACHLDVRRPQGVPRSHWWYFMDAAVH